MYTSKKLRTYARNPYRSLLDDATMLYSIMRHCYNIDTTTIKETLKGLHVRELDYEIEELDDLTVEKLITNFDISQLRQMSFTTNELKSFAFIKAFLTGYVDIITDLLSDNMIYKYQYVTIPNNLDAFFKEACLIDYKGNSFKAFRTHKNRILVLAESPNKKLLADIYLISLKLFDIIRVSEMEKGITQTSLKDIMKRTEEMGIENELNDESLAFILDQLKCQKILTSSTGHNFKYLQYNEIDSLSNIVFCTANLQENITAGYAERFSKELNINWDNNSVMMGKKKIFTLPTMAAVQSNISESILDINLNGIPVNWWLKSSRMQKLIHNEDIPVNKIELSQFGKYVFKNEKGEINIKSKNIIRQLEQIPFVLENISTEDIIADVDYRIKNMTFSDDNMPPLREDKNKEFIQEGELRVDSEPEDNEDDDMVEDSMGQLSGDMMRSMMSGFNLKSMNFTFTPAEDSSDSDSSEHDYEEGIFQNVSERSATDSTKSSENNFLTKDDFLHMIADYKETTTEFIKDVSHSVNTLKNIGDPTFNVVYNNMVPSTLLNHYGVQDKIGLLYRLKQILVLSKYITDMELLQCVTLLKKLLDNLSVKDEWKVDNDLVLRLDTDSNWRLFVKCVDNFDERTRNKVILKGGFTSKGDDNYPYIYVPLPDGRSKKQFAAFADNMAITEHLPMQTLNNCYQRLFTRPSQRVGYIMELLEEL